MADRDNPFSKALSFQIGCGTIRGDYNQPRLGATSELLTLHERWPPRELSKVFDLLCAVAARSAAASPWPDAMREVVDAAVDLAPGDLHQKLQWASAAISMLVHLRVKTEPAEGAPLLNDRRQRTRYSSYPTPPTIANAIADHLCRHLGPTNATVLDPTIEGAPILLECAHALAGRPVRLVGIDRNPAAIAASARLFQYAQSAAPTAYLQPELVCADSLDTIGSLGEIDGLASNPPWGERDRNGRNRFAGPSDPFMHFVNISLDQLREGGPFGLVLPGQAATASTAAGLRRRLTDTCTIDSVTTLPTSCFPRATVRAILILGRKLRSDRSNVTVVRYRAQPLSQPTAPPTYETCPQSVLGHDGAAWLSCLATEPPLRIISPTSPLGSLGEIASGIVPYRRGRGRPAQTTEIVAQSQYTYFEPRHETVPMLRSRQVRRYGCSPALEHVHLGEHLAYIGRHHQCPSDRRVYVRELCGRDGALVASVAPAGTVPRYGIFAIDLTKSDLDPHALVAILNSRLIARHVRSSCDGVLKESFNRVRVGDLRCLPIPLTLIGSPAGQRLGTLSRSIAVGSCSQDDDLRLIDDLVDQAYGVQK